MSANAPRADRSTLPAPASPDRDTSARVSASGGADAAPLELASEGSALTAGNHQNPLDDGPEQVPARAWVTMVGFAIFVIAFGTCASTFMFN